MYRTAAWQYKVGDVRILVIGATGVLGRPTVRQLVRQGHEVVALVKSAESAAVASFDGATPILGSLRSEEHTSELQSLLRISYAVFCLNKKKHTYTIKNINNTHNKYTKT